MKARSFSSPPSLSSLSVARPGLPASGPDAGSQPKPRRSLDVVVTSTGPLILSQEAARYLARMLMEIQKDEQHP